jgi:hypothetical protein
MSLERLIWAKLIKGGSVGAIGLVVGELPRTKSYIDLLKKHGRLRAAWGSSHERSGWNLPDQVSFQQIFQSNQKERMRTKVGVG